MMLGMKSRLIHHESSHSSPNNLHGFLRQFRVSSGLVGWEKPNFEAAATSSHRGAPIGPAPSGVRTTPL
jgi:hypothetical protein